MIEYEKEIIEYLGLPSIPKKRWDGKTSFTKGVAVLKTQTGGFAYAVCSGDENGDGGVSVSIRKVFSIEAFDEIADIFIVPNYMANKEDVANMDLDDASKKSAEKILEAATECENEGVEETPLAEPLGEYYFDNITNDEEARAFIKAYNKTNNLRTRVPKTHEGLLMRLSVIYNELTKEK